MTRARAPHWKTVVAATDFSPGGRAAATTAAELTARGGRLTLVHAVQLPPFNIQLLLKAEGVTDPRAALLEEAKIELGRHAARVRRPGLAVEARARFGEPWKVIVGAARDRGADLVVIGRSGHSKLDRMLLGSTAERVVRRSPVPVLVVGRAPTGIERVLLPFDLSRGSRMALDYAAARFPKRVALEALHVVPRSIAPWWRADAENQTAALRSFLGTTGATLATEVADDAAEGILRRARRGRFDLIVLATHGRGGVARALLGSVAEKVVRHARQPVLVVPGPGRGRRQAAG
jgi:nucleotide-binding universal stress UspA family protein